MEPTSKIYVAGISGMVGSAIARELIRQGYINLIGSYHKHTPASALLTPAEFDDISIHNQSPITAYQLDLTEQSAVHSFFAQHQPDYVVLAAAKVGGIMANNTYRADFIYQNLIMEANVIHAAHAYGVKKLLFLGSSCIYPKLAEQPMREEALLTGPLEPTNEPYAIAKIAGIRMCDAFNRQYGTNFISAMPTNLYGPGDNYNLETSHVLPALIRKMHLAKLTASGDIQAIERDEAMSGPIPDDILRDLGVERANSITETQRTQGEDKRRYALCSLRLCCEQSVVRLWGSGKPKREFLHVDDLASACVFLLERVNYQGIAFTDNSGTVQSHINISTGQEISIRELAEMVKETVGFQGEISWDSDKPDGTPRKLMDFGRMRQLGWKGEIGLKDGIAQAYADYLASL